MAPHIIAFTICAAVALITPQSGLNAAEPAHDWRLIGGALIDFEQVQTIHFDMQPAAGLYPPTAHGATPGKKDGDSSNGRPKPPSMEIIGAELFGMTTIKANPITNLNDRDVARKLFEEVKDRWIPLSTVMEGAAKIKIYR